MPIDDEQEYPLLLESYQLAEAKPEELGLTSDTVKKFDVPPLRLTICGQYFNIGAIDPVIKVGDIEVKDFEIQSDQCSIVCYLYEIPKQGSIISVDYGRGYCGKCSEPFSMNQLNRDGTV